MLVKTTFTGKTYSACFSSYHNNEKQKKIKRKKTKTRMLHTTYLLHETNLLFGNRKLLSFEIGMNTFSDFELSTFLFRRRPRISATL